MSLVQFQPMTNRQIANLLGQNAFEKSFSRPRAITQPAVNIAETATGFRIEIAAPGLAKEDFKISLSDRNVLTISAKKEVAPAETSETIHRQEFSFQTFEHAFKLPEQIDTEEPKAAYHQGILSLDLKKKPKNGHTVKTIQID